MGRWARKPVNHTSWVALVTPTDRPKSVRNRCLIELFCGVVCVVILPFWHFCWCRGFCHRTESDLFPFLLGTRKIIKPQFWDPDRKISVSGGMDQHSNLGWRLGLDLLIHPTLDWYFFYLELKVALDSINPTKIACNFNYTTSTPSVIQGYSSPCNYSRVKILLLF